jgi:hypothetical protein
VKVAFGHDCSHPASEPDTAYRTDEKDAQQRNIGASETNVTNGANGLKEQTIRLSR